MMICWCTCYILWIYVIWIHFHIMEDTLLKSDPRSSRRNRSSLSKRFNGFECLWDTHEICWRGRQEDFYIIKWMSHDSWVHLFSSEVQEMHKITDKVQCDVWSSIVCARKYWSNATTHRILTVFGLLIITSFVVVGEEFVCWCGERQRAENLVRNTEKKVKEVFQDQKVEPWF